MNRWDQTHNALSYQRVCIGHNLEHYADNATRSGDRYLLNILTRNSGRILPVRPQHYIHQRKHYQLLYNQDQN